jgi:hypothetical protein
MPLPRFCTAALLGLLWSAPSVAAAPVVDAVATAQANKIATMDEVEPIGRINQLLAARALSDAALFALAGTHPGLVEQLTSAEYRSAVDYIASLPAPELGRVRRGETVIRTTRDLRGDEKVLAEQMATNFGFKKDKLVAVRCSPLDGRMYRVEVNAIGKKKKEVSGTIELAWPSTPTRDDQSRTTLSKHFGARPDRSSQGSGALVPIVDGSFEDPASFGRDWVLEDGVVLGTRTPVADVVVDNGSAIDGISSIRFHATDKTRLFPETVQRITLAPYTRVRVRAQLRTENIRQEFQQQPDALFLKISFEDINGAPVGSAIIDRGRTLTHTWETLEVRGEAPSGTAYLRIAMFNGMSGSAWFDAVVVEIDY